MRKVAILSFIFSIFLATNSFAQQVPDLTDKDWTSLSKIQDLVGIPGAEILCDIKVYENKKENMRALVFEHKSNDFYMLYGKNDDNGSGVLSALRVGGVWYVAKEKGIDRSVSSVVNGTDGKPVALKLVLDTVNGSKEVILSFK